MGSPVSYSFPANQQVNVSVTDANGCSGPTLTYPVFVLDLNDHQLVLSSDTTVCPGGSAAHCRRSRVPRCPDLYVAVLGPLQAQAPMS